jgi:cAMP-dependent protein kinase regulator
MGCGGSVSAKPLRPDQQKGGSGGTTTGGATHIDEEDEKEMRRIRSMQSQMRRRGVSAESVGDKAISEYRKPVYGKTEEEQERIRTALQENRQIQVLCGHLDADSLQDVVNAFYPRQFPLGTDIIRQGDEGNCLYIVKEGKIDVFVARPCADGRVPEGDKGPKVVTFESGAIFGELALMYSSPRAATVTAAMDVTAWVMDALDFRMLMITTRQQSCAKYEGWLASVDLLKPLNHFELSTLADALSQEVIDPGEVIIRQGEAGDSFYILEDGSAAAFINGEQGELEVKTYSKVGDYFGELALLTDAPRAATVRATGEKGCAVVKMSMEDFKNLMGPIAKILRKHIDDYPQYAEFLDHPSKDAVTPTSPHSPKGLG